MLFSVIIPSFLGNYSGAASGRDVKIHRAIDSLHNQSFKDFEIILVADGCEKSYDIISKSYPDIKSFLIPKQPRFSGAVRNFGITKASGDYITYLDIDDKFGPNHLKIIADGIKQNSSPSWVFFNDIVHVKCTKYDERACSPIHMHQCGTSNISHKRDLSVWWEEGYLHDWRLIKELRRFEYCIIATPEYHVMHIPGKLDC